VQKSRALVGVKSQEKRGRGNVREQRRVGTSLREPETSKSSHQKQEKIEKKKPEKTTQSLHLVLDTKGDDITDRSRRNDCEEGVCNAIYKSPSGATDDAA